MSLSNQIIDFNDDYNHAIFKDIAKSASMPDMLKTASLITPDTKSSIKPEEFALVIFTKEGQELRKFPVNDAANTWLSAQYFSKTASKLPAKARVIAAGHIKAACAFYNLAAPKDLEKTAGSATFSNKYYEEQDFSKVASAPVIEGIVEDKSEHFYALGKSYAMPNTDYVKKAAAYFVDYEKEFDASDRNTFANNVLSRAKELNISLDEEKKLSKYANDSYGDILDIQLKIRKDLVEAKPEFSKALDKLASARSETDSQTFAKALHLFDKKAGLDKSYGSYLADAFQATFENRFKKEASAVMYKTAKGDELTEKEIKACAEKKYDEIKKHFGPSVANSLKKHGAPIFNSLPIDAKEVIASIMKG